MKRRRFMQTLAVTPAAALAVAPSPTDAAPHNTPATTAQTAETPVIKLETATLDAAGAPIQRYFTPTQFATLRKLSALLMPPLNQMPGALEAEAPEFLDFYVSKAPVERQQIYRTGLDLLHAQATRQFKKAFAELDDTQASTLLAPLKQAWTYVPPTEPLARFLREAKADVRNATINSHVYATASAAAGRRGTSGVGQYWYPLD